MLRNAAAIQIAQHRFRQLEREALDAVRRTALDCARSAASNDMGPQIRMNAAQEMLGDVHAMAGVLGVLMNLHAPEDAPKPDPDALAVMNEHAQKAAAAIVRRHMIEALQEIRRALEYRPKIEHASHRMESHALPRDHQARTIAACNSASPEGVRIDIAELGYSVSKPLQNLTWDMVTPHGIPTATALEEKVEE